MNILIYTRNQIDKNKIKIFQKRNKEYNFIIANNLTDGIKKLNNNNIDLFITDYNPLNSDVEPDYNSAILSGYAFAKNVSTIGYLKYLNKNYADRIKEYKVTIKDPLTAYVTVNNKRFLVENFNIPLNLMISESAVVLYKNIIESLENIKHIEKFKETLKNKKLDIGEHNSKLNKKIEGIYTAGPSVFILGTENNIKIKGYYDNPFEFKQKLEKEFNKYNLKINYPADGVGKECIFDNPEKWYKNKKAVAYEIFKADTKQMNISNGAIFDLQPHLSKGFDPYFDFDTNINWQGLNNSTSDSGTLFELGYFLGNNVKNIEIYNLYNNELKNELKQLNINISKDLKSAIKNINNQLKKQLNQKVNL